MAKILVTGSNGQVGQELQFLSKESTHTFLFTDVADLDITDYSAINDFFKEHQFDFCLNCAAYTAVDKAETDIELATKINVDGVKNLAQACLFNQTFLMQLSTDYVYHNTQNTPFKEGDPTNPQGVYAQTKLDGDLAALQVNTASMVIRTSWVYSSFGNNFVKTMIRLGSERDSLNVVFDQIGTPTYARDLASAMLDVVEKINTGSFPASKAYGVFHYSNEGVTSWYDFAKAIFDMENIDCNLGAIESVQYPTPAKRPPFSVLNKSKIKAELEVAVPHWRDGLKRCLLAMKG